jgi:LysR family hydrogen peroxide-inducible transcriptional activator
VPQLRRTYPGVEVELREAAIHRLMEDLAAGKLDIVIAALRLDIDGIRTRRLLPIGFFMLPKTATMC